jgi:hypothetical protein
LSFAVSGDCPCAVLRSRIGWPRARARRRPQDATNGAAMRGRGGSLGGLLYIIIGVVVALSNGYGITDLSSLLSFLLAMFLWPLVLLGINLHLALGA